MSLFLGKNNDGTAVLHMSKNTASQEYLKNYPDLVYTSFYSDLNYLRVKEWAFSAYIPDQTYSHGGWTFSDIGVLVFSDAFLSYVSTNKPAFFVTIRNKLVHTMSMLGSFMGYGSQFPCFYNNLLTDSVVEYPDFAHPKTFISSTDETLTLDDFRIYTTNVNLTSFIPDTLTNSIYVSNSVFNVRGVDIGAFDYITSDRLNSGDTSLETEYFQGDYSVYPPTVQAIVVEGAYLVNASKSTGSFSMIDSSIKRGDTILFDSNLSAGNIRYYAYFSKYIGHLRTASDTRICDEQFNEGDLFIVTHFFDAYKTYAASNFFAPLVFRNSVIATIGSFINFNQMSYAEVQIVGNNGYLYVHFTADIGSSTDTATCSLHKFTR